MPKKKGERITNVGDDRKVNGNDSGTRDSSSGFDSCDKRKDFGKKVNASIVGESGLGGERVFNGGYPFFNCHLNLLIQVARGLGADVGEASSWDSSGEGAFVRFRSNDSETNGTSFDRLAEPGVVETPGESTAFKAMEEALETKTQELKKAQDELATQGKELERTKERLGKLSQKLVGLERAAQASKDSAEHHKGLCNDANDALKRKTQSFEDQLAAREEEKELLDAKFDEVTTKCQGLEQKLQGAEDRCADMALKVKRKQELACEAEERASESEALCKTLDERLQCAMDEVVRLRIAAAVPVQVAVSTQTAVVEEVKGPEAAPQEAVQGSDQSLFGNIRHDAIWGTFPDDGHERKLLYTFVRRGCQSICRDYKFNCLLPPDQHRLVGNWQRHGWVVDEHIKNSPQVVMKRRVGYVDEIPDLDRDTWASRPGC